MSGGVVVLVVVVLAIGVGLAVLGAVAAAKRREALAAYAASRGWTWTEERHDLVDRFSGAPFGRGFGRRAFNVVQGAHDGRAFVAFDYVYKTQTSNGKTTTTHTHPFSVLAMTTTAPMPALSVEPEGLFDAIADKVSGGAIDLESEEFNQAFSVRCPDRKFASDVLHPLMMEHLLAHRWTGWRVDHDSLLVIEGGKREPQQIDAALAYADGVLDRVPEFVWARLRGEG
ncbi:DUF3137 domain-containing protein [Nocardioides flavescens]|uniref:DUF3137 domain-containing protein n=1 Tax=Nocardioides flavescens TaxID=2691959 RepID=A0A6L7EY81_9ACTN|nr:hypothetical protein [Nocardioides flavescens]